MKPRIAVALSGGGFRASIFHLGVLLRLAELGWLKDVDVFSAVSGGSIVAAFAVQRWSSFLLAGGDAAAFRIHIMDPFLRRVRENNFMERWLLASWTWPLRKVGSTAFTRTQAAAELFDSIFFENAACTSMPEHPLLILNATNLQSIRAWRFTRNGMGDSRVGHTLWGENPLQLSVCVGASAAFPPVFPPVRIKRMDYNFSAPLYGESPLHDYPLIALSDGGVYDNSGLEALTKPVALPGVEERLEVADFLIVSDGGAPASLEFDAKGVPVFADAALLYRVDGIARQQVSALRVRNLMSSFVSARRSGVLVGLSSGVDRLPKAMYEELCSTFGTEYQVPFALRELLQRVRTSLDRFEGVEVEALLYHAYSMTAAFTYCHRKSFPAPYQGVNLTGIWSLLFDSGRNALWTRELSSAAKTFRLR